MKDAIFQVFPDGHEIRQDKWQKIVKHPVRCTNAKRGNLIGDYAKYTYFISEHGFQSELRACHLPFSTARTTQSSRLGNRGTAEKRPLPRQELESRPGASQQATAAQPC